jgi:hypothetical protein
LSSHLTHFGEWNALLGDLPTVNGFVAIAAFATLLMRRGVQLESGWLDRSGLVIGMLWVGLLVYQGGIASALTFFLMKTAWVR